MIVYAEFAHDYLVALHEVGEHDDDGDVLLPDHAPEVVERADERALRRDELAPRVVALNMSTTISALTSYMYLHVYTCMNIHIPTYPTDQSLQHCFITPITLMTSVTGGRCHVTSRHVPSCSLR